LTWREAWEKHGMTWEEFKRRYLDMPDRDGRVPRKGSYMYETGHRGKKAGRKLGNCD